MHGNGDEEQRNATDKQTPGDESREEDGASRDQLAAEDYIVRTCTVGLAKVRSAAARTSLSLGVRGGPPTHVFAS